MQDRKASLYATDIPLSYRGPFPQSHENGRGRFLLISYKEAPVGSPWPLHLRLSSVYRISRSPARILYSCSDARKMWNFAKNFNIAYLLFPLSRHKFIPARLSPGGVCIIVYIFHPTSLLSDAIFFFILFSIYLFL